jgi:hypothetical protein
MSASPRRWSGVTGPARLAEPRASNRPSRGGGIRVRRAWVGGLVGLVAVVGSIGSAAADVSAKNAKDQALAQAGVITAADLPPSLSLQGAPQRDPGSKAFKGISDCKAVIASTDAAKRSTTRALSKDFSSASSGASAVLVNNTSYAFKDAGAATKFVAVRSTSTASSCLQKTLQKQLKGSGTTTANFGPITNLQNVGNQAVGYEGIIDQGQGQPQAYLDLVVVRVGRSVTSYEFLNPTQSLPQAPGIVNAVINRVAAAGA